jgi:hypothetical protein
LERGNFTAIGVEKEKIMKEIPRDKRITGISRKGKMKRFAIGVEKGNHHEKSHFKERKDEKIFTAIGVEKGNYHEGITKQ